MKIWKLVRDKIISKIIAQGEVANYRQANEAENPIAALDKLIEEAIEFKQTIEHSEGRARTIAEAADVQDAFDLCLKKLRISFSDVVEQQVVKNRECGGFEGMWLLEIGEE